jgi:hypothetical protein
MYGGAVPLRYLYALAANLSMLETVATDSAADKSTTSPSATEETSQIVAFSRLDASVLLQLLRRSYMGVFQTREYVTDAVSERETAAVSMLEAEVIVAAVG